MLQIVRVCRGRNWRNQAAAGANSEMQELGHVQLHATFHGAEQLEVEDGLAELQMQKTRVNTGYSGHTLTSTLPAPLKELNELLRQTKTSLMKLLTFPLSSVYKNELWVITCHMFFSKVLPLNVEIARSAALSL